MNYNNLNLIARIRAGSHLHGYNVESSDQDIYNIYMPTKDDILESFIDESKQNNKFVNNVDGVDETFMRFDKFIFNCLRGSPNSTDLLFATGENVLFFNDEWAYIVSNRYKFLGKQLIEALISSVIALSTNHNFGVFTRYLVDNFPVGFMFDYDEFCESYPWYSHNDNELLFLDRRTFRCKDKNKQIDKDFIRKFPKEIFMMYRLIGQLQTLLETGDDVINVNHSNVIRNIRNTEKYSPNNKIFHKLLLEISEIHERLTHKYTSKGYLDINKFDNYDHELFWKDFIKQELLQQLK